MNPKYKSTQQDLTKIKTKKTQECRLRDSRYGFSNNQSSFALSLIEYICTQGSLTLLAGEPHEQVYFGPCCMTVVRSDDDK